MRMIMKPKSQYYLIPFSFVFIHVIAAVNFALWGSIGKSVKALLIGFAIGVFYLVTLSVANQLITFDIFNTWWPLAYFYLLTAVSVRPIIAEQQKYLDNELSGKGKPTWN